LIYTPSHTSAFKKDLSSPARRIGCIFPGAIRIAEARRSKAA